jgi:hypothetical protein
MANARRIRRPPAGTQLPLGEALEFFADDFEFARAVITRKIRVETAQDRDFGPLTASDFVEALEAGRTFIRPRSQLLLRGLRTGVIVEFVGEISLRQPASFEDDPRVRAMRANLATGKVPGTGGYQMKNFWVDIRVACGKTETDYGYSTKALREV